MGVHWDEQEVEKCCACMPVLTTLFFPSQPYKASYCAKHNRADEEMEFWRRFWGQVLQLKLKGDPTATNLPKIHMCEVDIKFSSWQFNSFPVFSVTPIQAGNRHQQP